MFNHLYFQAAVNIAGEPVSIESDGSVWANSDHRDIDKAKVFAEYDRIVGQSSAATSAAIAHAKSLGFTDDMIAVMYPNLRSELPIVP